MAWLTLGRNNTSYLLRQVPDEILHDEALNQGIAVLPSNYNFEVPAAADLVARTQHKKLFQVLLQVRM